MKHNIKRPRRQWGSIKDAIIEAHGLGLTVKQISEKTLTTEGTVRNCLTRLGMKCNPSKPKRDATPAS